MPRLLLAVPLALLLLAAPVHAQSAREYVTAAKKAEKANNWKKALEQWQAAYKVSPDADYLVGMGDAYAKLGDKANAKKQYEAYLADPLALDGGKVKGKIAALEKTASLDDLGGLDLPVAPAAKPAGGGLDDLGLDLGAAPAAKGKKDKKDKKAPAGDLGLDLPAAPASKPVDLGLDLAPVAATPPKKPVAVASNDLGLDLAPVAATPPKKPVAVASNDLGLDLAPAPSKDKKPVAVASNDLGLDLAPAPSKDKKPVAVASNDLGLDLTPAPSKDKKPLVIAAADKPKPKDAAGDLLDSLSLPPTKPTAVAVTPPVATKPPVAIATKPPVAIAAAPIAGKPPAGSPGTAPKDPGTKVAVASTGPVKPPVAAKPPEPKAAPPLAVSTQQAPKSGDGDSSGKTRILAYVTAGVAVAGFGMGGLYLSKASQDNASLTERVHSGAEASALLEQQKTNKSLSFAGFATGLVLAGVATALFTF